MRQVNLGDLQVGITRLRDKAGASPQSLFDLVNGFVTASRSVRPRPSSKHIVTLPSGTKGLKAFAGKLTVFANAPVAPPISDPPIEVAVTMDPDAPSRPIQEVHFAEPFLGFLYVVVEFAGNRDGTSKIKHFWLQSSGSWKPQTVYLRDDVVEPTVKNGLAFSPTRVTDPAPQWTPETVYKVGDRVSPSVENGFEFVVDEVFGSGTSGTAEPAWPNTEGACAFDGEESVQTEQTTGITDGVQPNPVTRDRFNPIDPLLPVRQR